MPTKAHGHKPYLSNCKCFQIFCASAASVVIIKNANLFLIVHKKKNSDALIMDKKPQQSVDGPL
jgi:hypothetical protein